MDNYVDGHCCQRSVCVCHYTHSIIVVFCKSLYLLDESEFVGVVAFVGGPVGPADVGEVDNLNCPDDCNMHTHMQTIQM